MGLAEGLLDHLVEDIEAVDLLIEDRVHRVVVGNGVLGLDDGNVHVFGQLLEDGEALGDQGLFAGLGRAVE